MSEWARVSRKDPCPICGKPDWCTVSEDGAVACCMRIESDKPSRNGGFIHRLADKPKELTPQRRLPPPPVSRLDFVAMMAAWTRNTEPEDLATLAASLGVTDTALAMLGAAHASQPGTWAFPMKDGNGRIVGVRLRHEDGRKWAVRGSKEGLFFADNTPIGEQIVVCEGPTDTAAALSLGLWAVGRPSCMGAVDQTKRLLTRLRSTLAVVVLDNDEPKAKPDGGWWQPGFDGAMKLVAELDLPFITVTPPAKDLRAWVREGATKAQFEFLSSKQKRRKI